MTEPSYTPWEVNDTGGIECNGCQIAHVLDSEAARHARRIVASANSYSKNCGPNAIAAAEGDLLGELIQALHTCRDAIGGASPASADLQIAFAEATAALSNVAGEKP